MPTALQVMIPQGENFDPDDIEDVFQRYFNGVAEGKFQDTDTIRLGVKPIDTNLPSVYFEILPMQYLGWQGSYPDVEEEVIEDELDNEELIRS